MLVAASFLVILCRCLPSDGLHIIVLLRCVQKQSASLKAYKKWFKALLESSQALVDGRNEAADLDKEIKLREKDLQVP